MINLSENESKSYAIPNNYAIIDISKYNLLASKKV